MQHKNENYAAFQNRSNESSIKTPTISSREKNLSIAYSTVKSHKNEKQYKCFVCFTVLLENSTCQARITTTTISKNDHLFDNEDGAI